tara:strand:+ start:450 stop:605 length:156 start_codon:yes stop_codon:yes gene_type:complete
MSNELAAYIADYINEELNEHAPPTRPNMIANFNIDSDMILNAVDAYEGGAR